MKSDYVPALEGEYDDVCPIDARGDELDPSLLAEDEDELEHVAVLGYN